GNRVASRGADPSNAPGSAYPTGIWRARRFRFEVPRWQPGKLLATGEVIFMKLGILSDTHDEVERTSRAVAALVGAGAEALVHCGDLTVPEVVLECGGLPSYFVFGNNDFDRDGLLRAMALVGGRGLGRGGVVTLDG